MFDCLLLYFIHLHKIPQLKNIFYDINRPSEWENYTRTHKEYSNDIRQKNWNKNSSYKKKTMLRFISIKKIKPHWNAGQENVKNNTGKYLSRLNNWTKKKNWLTFVLLLFYSCFEMKTKNQNTMFWRWERTRKKWWCWCYLVRIVLGARWLETRVCIWVCVYLFVCCIYSV